MEKSLTQEEVELINSKIGLATLLSSKKVNIERTLDKVRNENAIQELQKELIHLQNWVIANGKKVVILFEGRDAAGKGGAIRRITERINPRHFKIVALNIPTSDEKQQWFFQRYVNELPKPGQIVFFDRSWYNRAVVEPVNGFCTEAEYDVFMSQVNAFEKMIIQADTYLVKIYFSIDKNQQAKRFKEIKDSPLKQWKITPVDLRAQELWDEYSRYKRAMFEQTNSSHAPWKIIDANRKSSARLAAMSHILENIPYKRKERSDSHPEVRLEL
jgi:polyphosphate kinase 2